MRLRFCSNASAGSDTAALWHFNESSGNTATDSSGNGNTATVGSSTTPYPRWARMEYGRYYPGTANTMWVANNTTLNPTSGFSFEAWIKPEDVSSANRTIFRQAGTYPKYLRFKQQGGSSLLSFALSINGSLRTLDVSITPSQWVDDRWHYVAATYDSTSSPGVMKLYKDGSQIGSLDITDSTRTLNAGDDAYQLGAWDGWIEGFKGTLDEVRIYRAARTATQISEHWTPNVDPGNQGNVLLIESDGDQIGLSSSIFHRPTGIAVSPNGTVWVANNGAYTEGTGGNGSSVTNVNSSGTGISEEWSYDGPWGVDVDSNNNVWWAHRNGVKKVVPGTSSAEYAFPSQGMHPRGGLAIGPDDTIWVANDATHNVTKMLSSGTIVGHYTVGNASTSEPLGIVVDSYKSVWVTDRTGDAVHRLDSNGVLLGTYPLPAGTRPWGIALDAKGNPWIAGYGNDTLIKLGR